MGGRGGESGTLTATRTLRFWVIAAVGLSACTTVGGEAPLPSGAQARSLSGEVLYPPPIASSDLARREEELARARAELEAKPGDLEAQIWVGRRLGYLGRFREAVDAFTLAALDHPDDPRPWRFRGHRYITLRRFDDAQRDLEEAARRIEGRPDEVEPSGAPNARGIELDTLNQNVHYHLGLARYLRGDLEGALAAWRDCRRFSNNADALCSVTHWLYTVLRRLGREAEAQAVLDPIRADLDVVEYHAYHRLLLAYKGELDPASLLASTSPSGASAVDFATIGYGIANMRLCDGERVRALETLRQVEACEAWHAFGRIAAEAELHRLGAGGL
jgi:tetratricopeptide (TPR) repeat protein